MFHDSCCWVSACIGTQTLSNRFLCIKCDRHTVVEVVVIFEVFKKFVIFQVRTFRYILRMDKNQIWAIWKVNRGLWVLWQRNTVLLLSYRAFNNIIVKRRSILHHGQQSWAMPRGYAAAAAVITHDVNYWCVSIVVPLTTESCSRMVLAHSCSVNSLRLR